MIALGLWLACSPPRDTTDTVAPDTVDTPPDTEDDTDTAPEPLGGNVIVVVIDDVGIDKTAPYGEFPTGPPLPAIASLVADGVLFRNAYSSPTCSPSRASLLTGRYPTRHGIGRWIYAASEAYALPEAEVTIPDVLARAPDLWATAAVGKWHLAGFASDDPLDHPNAMGFDHYAGSLANPLEAVTDVPGTRGYSNWEKVTDGVPAATTRYMTVDTFDDAIAQVTAMPEPFFLYVATNGAHTPLHDPPPELLVDALPSPSTELDQYHAILQIVDRELGRFLDAIPVDRREHTTIVLLADNGSPREVDVIRPPWDPDRAKGTVYEAGVNVPFVVSGPLVANPGTESAAFVHVVDLLPTIAEIAGVPADALGVTLDGRSLVPYLRDPTAPSARDVAFTEDFYPNDDQPTTYEYRDRTVRDEGWKLVEHVRDGATTLRFFRMEAGAVDEGPDLLGGALTPDEQAAYDRLLAELARLDAELVYGP